MTILFLARRFYPQIGGVEKHVLEIGKRLVKQGHKVIVITELEKNTNKQDYHSRSGSAKLAGKVEGIEIYRIDVGVDDWFKKFRIWGQLWGLQKIFNNADVVHCHDVFFWYLPFRFLLPTKKVYTTFHGYEGNFLPTKKAILMHKLSEKLSYGNICIGGFFEKWYGTKSKFVSYGAVEDNVGKKEITDRNLIVFLGRLETETGIMEYLKAFKEVLKTYKGLRLVVLGDGALMSEALKFTKDNNLPVDYKGFIENTAKFVERASFMFTSRYLGILESMLSKKYVLAVYNNGIKEDYLKMTPFADYISISKDSTGIVSQLEKYLIDEKLKIEKINKAYDFVKTETWEKMVNLYLQLWKSKK
jgi:glycosyltransferase involved in cell wall biosynthesis